jgi:hypothetical protein
MQHTEKCIYTHAYMGGGVCSFFLCVPVLERYVCFNIYTKCMHTHKMYVLYVCILSFWMGLSMKNVFPYPAVNMCCWVGVCIHRHIIHNISEWYSSLHSHPPTHPHTHTNKIYTYTCVCVRVRDIDRVCVCVHVCVHVCVCEFPDLSITKHFT